MANNVYISYDLYQYKENYEQVRSIIEGLGSWSRIHLSLWFIKPDLSAKDIAAKVWEAMEDIDMLIVVDASYITAYWYCLTDVASNFLAVEWGSLIVRT